ncbi:single-stranded DNA-binding protein [uncultured Parolsenella sp.]|uniref:single-stranded DNA-binding protein n=1 Tax=uncultured Parolsenella sp. TaxID=2083008 RepID=UPI0025D37FCB|nr:single-stranded DNA-binding protein [uncultured Parolsenella sp.]
MSINRVNITGNLTRDPELRATQSGTQVLHLGVAVNDRRRNPQTGNWEDYPNFIDCVMFGTRAEAIQRYLSKGTKVAIEGRLRYSSWERDGQKRSKIEVVVDEIEFMSSRQGGGNSNGGGYAQQQGGYAAPAQQAPYQQAAPAPAPVPVAAPPAADVYDEDIPF